MHHARAQLLASAALLMTCGVVLGDTYREEDHICPIDGTAFQSRHMMSGYQRTTRLDLKPVGNIAAPRPIPVCPTDHFVVLEYEPETLEKLKSYIPSDEYQGYAAVHKASYALLAKIRDFLGFGPLDVGYAYLQASWESEDRPHEQSEYLRLSLQHHLKALEGSPELTRESFQVELLAAELERRLGDFDSAQRRLRRIETSEYTSDRRFRLILDYQLQLVAALDKEPHEIPDLPPVSSDLDRPSR